MKLYKNSNSYRALVVPMNKTTVTLSSIVLIAASVFFISRPQIDYDKHVEEIQHIMSVSKQQAKVNYNRHLLTEKEAKILLRTAIDINTSIEVLYYLIDSESSWNPQAKNGQYRGLWQMGRAVAQDLGTTPEAFAKSSPSHQLRLLRRWLNRKVGQYYKKKKEDFKSFAELKAIIMWPAAMQRLDEKDPVLYCKSKHALAYKKNAGMDTNVDGCITFSDLNRWFQNKYYPVSKQDEDEHLYEAGRQEGLEDAQFVLEEKGEEFLQGYIDGVQAASVVSIDLSPD